MIFPLMKQLREHDTLCSIPMAAKKHPFEFLLECINSVRTQDWGQASEELKKSNDYFFKATDEHAPFFGVYPHEAGDVVASYMRGLKGSVYLISMEEFDLALDALREQVKDMPEEHLPQRPEGGPDITEHILWAVALENIMAANDEAMESDNRVKALDPETVVQAIAVLASAMETSPKKGKEKAIELLALLNEVLPFEEYYGDDRGEFWLYKGGFVVARLAEGWAMLRAKKKGEKLDLSHVSREADRIVKTQMTL